MHNHSQSYGEFRGGREDQTKSEIFKRRKETSNYQLPDYFQDVVSVGLHNEVGHPGIKKTVWSAKQRVYWPGLQKDINYRVEICERCIEAKHLSYRDLIFVLFLQSSHFLFFVLIFCLREK